MPSDEYYREAVANLTKGRITQKEKRESEPGYIPTAQNKYYIEYQRWKSRCMEARDQRDNARFMVDVLFKTIRNIMPVYQEYIKRKMKEKDAVIKDKPDNRKS